MEYVVVIDRNTVVLSIIKKWLLRLGFKEVQTCTLAEDGLQQLKKMKERGIVPIVFIGYDLEDMNCLRFIKEAFNIINDLIIIVETTHDSAEPFIKDLFSNGVFHYIKKPVRFVELKNLIDTIKDEYELLGSGYNFTSIEVELLLKRTQRMSIARISQMLAVPSDEISPILARLVEKGQIKLLGLVKEIACKKCNSVLVSVYHCCPQCESSNFENNKIIEHYKCGNVAPKSDYVNDVCPKCNRTLKEFGLDYRVVQRFLCGDCKDIFENLQLFYHCDSCGNKFQIDDADWKISKSFISLIDTTNNAPSTITEFDQLENITV